MKAKIKINFFIISLAFLQLFFYACNQKSDTPGLASVRISMVDAPGDFDSLIISVEEVFVNVSGSGSDWQELDNFQSGSYDLLKLVNGNEWLLGETSLPEGRLSQVRLLLGDGTRLYTDDTVFVLRVPSAYRSGLKININEYLEGGITYNLILDFDAAKSIVFNRVAGNYTLKPLIHGILSTKSGAIKGKINPGNKKYRVLVTRGTDTFNTYSERNGEFLFPALDPGIYELKVPNDSGMDISISEIAIRAGEVKDLGDLRML